MIRKLLIVPYFGPMPPWIGHFWRNAEWAFDDSYSWLIPVDETEFRLRVEDRLEVTPPSMTGNGKSWDYRPALGHLYADELEGYDFWGHVDFDCVFGRVNKWITDEFLDGIDIHSNCESYVNGCWSLYRNVPVVNEAFMGVDGWQATLEEPRATGWAETSYSEHLREMHDEGLIRLAWTQWQTFEVPRLRRLRWDGDRLMDGASETMMAHFRRTKEYPAGCIT